MTKPSAWPWVASGVETAFLGIAAKLRFLLPLWETSGAPVELISGQPMTVYGAPAWGTVGGVWCLTFAVGDRLTLAAGPLNSTPTSFSIGAAFRHGPDVEDYLGLTIGGTIYAEVDADDSNYRELASNDASLWGALGSPAAGFRPLADAYYDDGAGNRIYRDDFTDVGLGDNAWHGIVSTNRNLLGAGSPYEMSVDGADALDEIVSWEEIVGSPVVNDAVIVGVGAWPSGSWHLVGALGVVASFEALTVEEANLFSSDPYGVLRMAAVVPAPSRCTTIVPTRVRMQAAISRGTCGDALALTYYADGGITGDGHEYAGWAPVVNSGVCAIAPIPRRVRPQVQIVSNGEDCGTGTYFVWFADGTIRDDGEWLAGDGAP